jgi:hypothetical protein
MKASDLVTHGLGVVKSATVYLLVSREGELHAPQKAGHVEFGYGPDGEERMILVGIDETDADHSQED